MDQSPAAWFLQNVKLEYDAPFSVEEQLSETKKDRGEKPKTERKKATRFSDSQLKILKKKFEESQHLKKGEAAALAAVLKLDERVVRTWFTNRRCKEYKVAWAQKQKARMNSSFSNGSFAPPNFYTPLTSDELFSSQLATSPIRLALSPIQSVPPPVQLASLLTQLFPSMAQIDPPLAQDASPPVQLASLLTQLFPSMAQIDPSLAQDAPPGAQLAPPNLK
ncbi:hypothetical protein CAEBREN_18079 [Caenorhabditis brenneri]|uniref:Homeobox domain-containing protein n=1 Tax=Caenorhabditis brenneri TaxID=135651 RepID=G0N4A5_CAEBE|nr:hypothetical protein CAEBREN_18079 [Caenorhabditis brenneri]